MDRLEIETSEELPLFLDETLFDIWEIYKTLPGNYFWKDISSRYIWANENALKLLQFSDESTIIDKTDYELWPQQAAIFIENDKKILSSGETSYFEENFECDTQTKCVIVTKSPLVNSFGKILGIIGSFIQSDQIKKDQGDLCIKNNSQQKEAAYKYINSIIEAVPGSIYWKNKEGVWIGCNEFTIQTTGIQDIIGKTDYQLWPDQAQSLRKHDLEVMRTGRVLKEEETVILPNGERRTFAVVKMPLRDEHNQIVGVVGNSIDITDLKKTQRKLINAKKKAEAANQAKTEFLANMRHDIRTSLSGIVGFSEILRQKLSDPKFKEYAQNLVASAQSLHVLMDEILESIIVSTGEIPLLKKKFSLSDTLTSITQLYAAKAAEKQLELTLSIAETLPKFIIGDKIRFHRIILELVGNALNFTAIGHVAIRSVSAEMRQI